MACSSCGKELTRAFRFCPFCGEDQVTKEASAASTDDTIAEIPAVVMDVNDGKATVIDAPAVTQEDLDADDPAKGTEGETAPDSSDPRFSETAWFMAAVSPEQLAEGEGEPTDFTEQERMTEAYETEDSLPEEVRKEYSLTLDRTKAVQPEDLESGKPTK